MIRNVDSASSGNKFIKLLWMENSANYFWRRKTRGTVAQALQLWVVLSAWPTSNYQNCTTQPTKMAWANTPFSDNNSTKLPFTQNLLGRRGAGKLKKRYMMTPKATWINVRNWKLKTQNKELCATDDDDDDVITN